MYMCYLGAVCPATQPHRGGHRRAEVVAGASGNVGSIAVIKLDREHGPVGNQALPAWLLGDLGFESL